MPLRLGAEDLDHPAARHPAHAEGEVEPSEPVGMAGTCTAAASSPMRMMAPLPNCRSICTTAISSAFSFSTIPPRLIGPLSCLEITVRTSTVYRAPGRTERSLRYRHTDGYRIGRAPALRRWLQRHGVPQSGDGQVWPEGRFSVASPRRAPAPHDVLEEPGEDAVAESSMASATTRARPGVGQQQVVGQAVATPPESRGTPPPRPVAAAASGAAPPRR